MFFTLKRSHIDKFFYVLALLAVIFLLYKTFSYTYYLVTHPYLLQYREVAALLTTQALIEGKNPHLIVHYPWAVDAYSIVLSYLSYPLTLIFGNSLPLHRTIAVFFALLCSGVVSLILYRRKVKLIYILSGIGIIHCSLLFHKTMTAEPDCIGLFWLLLGLFLCEKTNYKPVYLGLALFLALMGLYTKLYFVLLAPMLCSYLFFFYSKKNSIILGILFLFLFFTSLLGAYELVPASILHTCFSNNLDQVYSFGYVIFQLKAFVNINSGLIILGIIAYFVYYLQKKTNHTQSSYNISNAIDITNFNKPFFTNFYLDSYQYALLIGILLIIFVLGGTRGAYLYYHFTFITPFLVIVVLSATSKEFTFSLSTTPTDKAEKPFLRFQSHYVLFSLALLGFWGTFVHKGNLKQMSQTNIVDWEKARQYTKDYHNVLGNPPVSLFLHQQGKKVYDTGHTEYLMNLKNTKAPIKTEDFEQLKQKAAQWRTEVKEKLNTKKFDLVFYDGSCYWYLSEKDLEQNYIKIDTLTLNMPHVGYQWATSIWKPKK